MLTVIIIFAIAKANPRKGFPHLLAKGPHPVRIKGFLLMIVLIRPVVRILLRKGLPHQGPEQILRMTRDLHLQGKEHLLTLVEILEALVLQEGTLRQVIAPLPDPALRVVEVRVLPIAAQEALLLQGVVGVDRIGNNA
jgi:hypothetical protein